MEKATKSLKGYFTKAEIALWCASVGLIIASFCIFDRSEYMTLAAITDILYISVVICFVMFLANDIYGFISWSHMKKGNRQVRKKWR